MKRGGWLTVDNGCIKRNYLCCLIYSQPLNPYLCKNVRKKVFKAADDIFGPGCMSMIEYCFMKKLAITIS